MIITEQLLEFIFPSYCVNCGKFGEILCQQCYQQITFYALPIKIDLHGRLNSLMVMAHYEGVTKKLLMALKYQHLKAVGNLLGRILFYSTVIPQVDVITAVPLHRKRKNERGYNQSEEIARSLGACMGIPYRNLLKRTVHTSKQASISNKKERLTRLSGIFSYTDTVNFSRVLIVDDVFTTGATMQECASVLNSAGCTIVHGLAVAHGA